MSAIARCVRRSSLSRRGCRSRFKSQAGFLGATAASTSCERGGGGWTRRDAHRCCARRLRLQPPPAPLYNAHAPCCPPNLRTSPHRPLLPCLVGRGARHDLGRRRRRKLGRPRGRDLGVRDSLVLDRIVTEAQHGLAAVRGGGWVGGGTATAAAATSVTAFRGIRLLLQPTQALLALGRGFGHGGGGARPGVWGSAVQVAHSARRAPAMAPAVAAAAALLLACACAHAGACRRAGGLGGRRGGVRRRASGAGMGCPRSPPLPFPPAATADPVPLDLCDCEPATGDPGPGLSCDKVRRARAGGAGRLGNGGLGVVGEGVGIRGLGPVTGHASAAAWRLCRRLGRGCTPWPMRHTRLATRVPPRPTINATSCHAGGIFHHLIRAGGAVGECRAGGRGGGGRAARRWPR